MRIGFADFSFDTEARELRRSGKVVHLSPRAFELMALLLQARPRVLPKEELLTRLWPDVVVTEGSLTSLVAEVRRALGEHGRSNSWIRTVHGFGYSFGGEARPEAEAGPDLPAARCVITWAGGEAMLPDGETILGREPGLAARVDHTTVSRNHARITVTGAGATIEDLGSKNGTFVRGERVTGPVPLGDGAAIKLGSVVLTFRWPGADNSTRTVREETGSPSGS